MALGGGISSVSVTKSTLSLYNTALNHRTTKIQSLKVQKCKKYEISSVSVTNPSLSLYETDLYHLTMKVPKTKQIKRLEFQVFP